MRNVIPSRTIPLFLAGLVLCLAARNVTAQISVGTNGVPLITFSSAPPVAEWSTLSIAGGAFDVTNGAGMDAQMASISAATITTALASSNASPPNGAALAVWSTTGYLQTRPNNNRATLLMATLTNGSGVWLSTLNLAYNLTNATVATEEIPGHRLYYSTSGLAGTWQNVAVDATPGRKNLSLYLGPWPHGARCHLLWADDNASSAPDAAYQIDNVAATVVAAAPSITALSIPPNAAPGEPIAMSVVATGVLPLNYQWRKDGNDLPGANSSTHVIAAAQLSDAGVYSVMVSNVAGYVSSTGAMLSVVCLPLGLASGPASQAVNAGTPVTLSCSATGSPPSAYQWFKNSVAVPGATNASLVFNPAYVQDAGTYRVAVTNCSGGLVSDDAVLTVNCVPISFGGQPSNQSTDVGGNISVSVTLSGSPPIQIQWHRNGVALAGATNSALAFSNVATSDSGYYHATVTNCGGVVSSRTAIVAVARAPLTVIGLTNQFWRYDQSGTCRGAEWYSTNFDDTVWPLGRGVLAQENQVVVNALTNTVLSLTNASGARVTNHLFRTRFTLTNELADMVLVASNLIDDGCVAYLNGTELYRFNMAVANLDCTTFAPLDSGEGVFAVTNIPLNRINAGENLLAIEVHQVSASSSDVVMGLSLTAVFAPPSPLSITNQPADILTDEGKTVTFSVGVKGAGASFQWFKDGAAFQGATRSSLTLSNLTVSDSGTFVLMVSNAFGAVFSRLANLSVRTDETAPRIVFTEATNLTMVLVVFTEALLESTATNIANFRVLDAAGNSFAVTHAILTNGTNVLLTTAFRPPGTNYHVAVTNVADASVHQNVVAPGTAALIVSRESLVPFGAHWRFFDPFPPFDDPDPGPVWMQPDFYVPAYWGEGDAPFYGGTNAPNVAFNTALPILPPVATYFRSEFMSDHSPLGSRIFLDHALDDGAVVYLNGTEVTRFNMGPGAVSHLTAATGLVVNVAQVGDVEINASLLRPGLNVLAVELHQVTANDDRHFDARLRIRAETLATGPLRIFSGPEDVTVAEDTVASFRVSAQGAATIQWLLNGAPVAGATNAAVHLFAPLALDGAVVSALLTGPAGTLSSTGATLRVRRNDTPLLLVGAWAETNATITVRFNKPLLAETATVPVNFLVTNQSGGVVPVLGATLVDQTNVVLQFAALPAAAYTVVVNDVRDSTTRQNTIWSNSTVTVGYQGLVVPISAWWRYNQSGTDLGTAWRQSNYDDFVPGWQWGQSLFEGKRGSIPALPETVLTLLTLSNANNTAQLPTYYFRARFDSFGSGEGFLSFRTILDDGMVAYLNGVEVLRVRMPAGTISYSTRANVTISDAAYEGPFLVPVNNLVAGENILAVEVHQDSLTSSDITWAGEFSMFVPSVPRISGPLRLHRWGNMIAVEPSGTGTIIERAPTVTGPWTAVPATGTLFVEPAGPGAYFRARP
jgi:hypothetical protein